jgi:hypothetical protein
MAVTKNRKRGREKEARRDEQKEVNIMNKKTQPRRDGRGKLERAVILPENILQDKLAFLSHFPYNHHTKSLDLVCKAARKALRAGMPTPQAVSEVLADLCWRQGGDFGGPYDTTRRLLAQQPEAIHAGAKWGLWWESLTPRERKALNRESLERLMSGVRRA